MQPKKSSDVPKIEIEEGIPIWPPSPPVRGSAPLRTYPWREMEVGDSFFVPFGHASLDAFRIRGSVSAAANAAARILGVKFATRKQADGVRVWRVE